jgi:5-methylcytosine-specific restriction endonuclease McrA
METMRKCSGCGTAKPATRDHFGGTGTARGGLRGRCRECEKVAKRAYEATHKDERRIREDKRAEVTGGTRGSFKLPFKQQLFAKQKGLCLCCFKQIPSADQGEVDHAKPAIKGGTEESSNLHLVHAQCNKEKHSKTLQEHWEWRVKVKLDPENLGRKHGLIK